MFLIEEGLFALGEEMIKIKSKDINLTLCDSQNENIFFKIIKSPFDVGKNSLFKNVLTLLKDETEEEEQKETLEIINDAGESLIEASLNIGNSDISSKLFLEGVNAKVKNEKSGENILHFAVKGKNPYCLKLVLNNVDNSTISQMSKEKNNAGLTPLELARKLELSQMVRQLNETDISTQKKKRTPSENNDNEIFDLLSQFKEDNSEKVIKTITDNYYLTEWNKIMLEYMKQNNTGKKYSKEIYERLNGYFEDVVKIVGESQEKEEEEVKIEEGLAEENVKKEMASYGGTVRNKSRFDFVNIENNGKESEDREEEKEEEINDADDRDRTRENLGRLKFDKKLITFYLNLLTNSFINKDIETGLQIYKQFLAYISKLNKKDNIIKNSKDDKNKKMNKSTEFIFYTNASIMLIEQCLNSNLFEYSTIFLSSLITYIKNFTSPDSQENGEKVQSLTGSDLDLTEEFLKYLSHNEIINPSLNYSTVPLLLECFYCNKIGDYEKSRELLSEFKEAFAKIEKNKNALMEPLLNTLSKFYYYLKIQTDFLSNNYFDFHKHMEKMVSYKGTCKFYDELFYYNTYGIMNLKQKKYTIAEFCFKKCLLLSTQNQMLTHQFTDGLLYNLGLCLFFSRDFQKSHRIFSKVKQAQNFSSNPHLFYRLGISCLQLCLKKGEKISREENQNEILKEVLVDEEISEKNLRTRYVLVSQENKGVEEDDEYLIEAIDSFRSCLAILNGQNFAALKLKSVFSEIKRLENVEEFIDRNSLEKLEEKQQKNYYGKFMKFSRKLSEVRKNEAEKEEDSGEDGEKEGRSSSKSKIKDRRRSVNKRNLIYLNAHLYLIFSLIKNKNYTEALEMISSVYANPEIDTTDFKLTYILNNYLVDVYLKLNNFEKALEILSQLTASAEKIDGLKGSFLTEENHVIYHEISFKLSLFVNLVKMHLLNKNEKEAESVINSMLGLINSSSDKSLPPFVII